MDSGDFGSLLGVSGNALSSLELTVSPNSLQKENGTLFNVLDGPNSFADTASTALLASVTYRMATFTNNTSLLPYANKALNLVKSSIDNDGWLFGTTDPYTFHTPSPPTQHSPEGQAFVLLLHAAWRAQLNSAHRKW